MNEAECLAGILTLPAFCHRIGKKQQLQSSQERVVLGDYTFRKLNS